MKRDTRVFLPDLGGRCVYGVVLLLLPLLLFSCGDRKGTLGVEVHATEDTVVYEVRCERAELDTLPAIQTYTASVLPYEENAVGPGLAARIYRLHVDVGDRVKAGDVLVEMDPTQLLQAEVQFVALEENFRRMDTLRKVGSVSQQQYEQLKAQYEVSKASVENLRRNSVLRSPISGVITGRYYNVGELYSMAPSVKSNGQAAIYTVMQDTRLKVRFSVEERLYPEVRVGQRAWVEVDAYAGDEFEGSVSRIWPAVDAMSHTFQVEVELPNAGLKLRPGMFARVRMNFGQVACVQVKDMAVQQQRGSNERYLFVVEGDVVRRVVVQVGGHQGDRLNILRGLSGGEQVVVAGVAPLRDGVRVRQVAVVGQ